MLDDKPPGLARIAETLSSAARPFWHAATLLEYARTYRFPVAITVCAGSSANGLEIAAQLRNASPATAALFDLIYQRCTGITQRIGRMERAGG